MEKIVSLKELMTLDVIKPDVWIVDVLFNADLDLLKIWDITIAIETTAHAARVVGKDVLSFLECKDKEKLVHDMLSFTLLLKGQVILKVYQFVFCDDEGIHFEFTKDALQYICGGDIVA